MDERFARFEGEFDEKHTYIGSLTTLHDDFCAIFIHAGLIRIPIWHDDDVGDNPPAIDLTLSKSQARDLAGLLIYAAGRVGELDEFRCYACGKLGHDGDHCPRQEMKQ
jgi:hypothetical protein